MSAEKCTRCGFGRGQITGGLCYRCRLTAERVAAELEDDARRWCERNLR